MAHAGTLVPTPWKAVTGDTSRGETEFSAAPAGSEEMLGTSELPWVPPQPAMFRHLWDRKRTEPSTVAGTQRELSTCSGILATFSQPLRLGATGTKRAHSCQGKGTVCPWGTEVVSWGPPLSCAQLWQEPAQRQREAPSVPLPCQQATCCQDCQPRRDNSPDSHGPPGHAGPWLVPHAGLEQGGHGRARKGAQGAPQLTSESTLRPQSGQNLDSRAAPGS